MNRLPQVDKVNFHTLSTYMVVYLCCRLQERIQEQLENIQPIREPKSQKLVHISQHQQKELQTVVPVIWEQVQVIKGNSTPY